jgi:HSP20 family molecular chaperone IbpA
MRSRDLSNLMWTEALSLLEQADRLQRQFFRAGSAESHVWEPPVDVIETADALIVHVALPGVAADTITIGIEPEAITVSALRPFAGAATASGARIHRVEIPYGRFARRIALPMQVLQLAGRTLADGCLTLTFAKRGTRGNEPRNRVTDR